jgi:hypothetical protein
MKAELRNRDRYPNGVVKMTQLRLASLSNQTASQSVAVSRSDFWDGVGRLQSFAEGSIAMARIRAAHTSFFALFRPISCQFVLIRAKK